MQYGFYRYALLADLIWLIAERAFTINSRKAGTCLFGASLAKTIKALLSSSHANCFLLTGEAGITECPGL